MANTKPFQIRIPLDLKARMDKRKNETGESLTDQVVNAVKQYLN